MMSRRLAVAVSAAAVVSACSGETGTPVGPTVVARHGVSGASPFQHGSVRYRNAGMQARVGRAGSAAITVEAFAGRGGITTLLVTSARASDPSAPAGAISRVQVKAFDASGRPLFTRNADGPGLPFLQLPLGGLVPGMLVDVTAHVRGIDGRRTDVVTVAGVVVVLAPDPALVRLSAPAYAVAGSPVLISADVRERGGAHGASADCVLYAGGAEVDRATGIWVDAGDLVSCAFTPTFAAPGPVALRVALERVSPWDGDGSNNAATAAIIVVAPDPTAPASWVSGAVTSGSYAMRDTFAMRWNYPDGSLWQDYATGSSESGTTQSITVSGMIQAPVAFPLTRVDVGLASGGRGLHAGSWTAVPADVNSSGGSCVSLGVGTGTEFYLCARATFTTWSYQRLGGTVTYFSSGYQTVWNGSSYDTAVWADNGSRSDGAMLPLGGSLQAMVHIIDGSRLFQSGGRAVLTAFTDVIDDPLTCVNQQLTLPPTTYDVRACSAFSWSFTGVAGSFDEAGVAGVIP